MKLTVFCVTKNVFSSVGLMVIIVFIDTVVFCYSVWLCVSLGCNIVCR